MNSHNIQQAARTFTYLWSHCIYHDGQDWYAYYSCHWHRDKQRVQKMANIVARKYRRHTPGLTTAAILRAARPMVAEARAARRRAAA